MTRIGILSDTHCYIDKPLLDFFNDCDELWHAGDIGDIATADSLARFKPLRAVHGNIDNHVTRSVYKEFLRFTCEEVDVLITHIGGYPERYDPRVKRILEVEPPKLFICGHSHILKVIYDKKYQLLHINPGAAGISGFHNVRTAVRLVIDKQEIKNLEILELKRH